jgi:hypothetical protein
MRSNREIVLVLATSALSDPEHDCGKHKAHVLCDVGVPVVLILIWIPGNNVLEYQ